MKHMKRFLALAMACLLVTAGGLAMAEKITVTEEEYALLQKYQRLEEIQSIIKSSYLWEYDEEALMEGAAQGMLGALGDNYTFYYTTSEMESEMESITGEYGGLGIEVYANTNDMTITIRRVFYGSPAQQAGLRPSDKIIQVNGQDVSAYDLNLAVSMMRGEVGGEVTLTILRDSEIFEITCERAIIETQILTYEMLEDGIGYARIHYFEGNAVGQFEEVIEEFKRQGISGLVIDLRDNPGGLVTLAVNIADIFLDDQLVAMSEDKYGRRLSYYSKKGAWEIPVVILQNEYSASASELFAAALKENGVAKIVGVTSYGKGIMQTVYPFADDGAGMQLTTDYWLTPTGACIHETGIEPDVVVELNDDAIDENYNIILDKDDQLKAAITLLKEEIGN